MTQETFDGYWLRFVRDHQKPGTQYAHLAGNLASLAVLWRGLFGRRLMLLLAAPLPALLAARLSHKYIEQNVPLSAAENPSWFLRCELRMARHLVFGTMQAEVERARAAAEEPPPPV
jgi:hypothetical protein